MAVAAHVLANGPLNVGIRSTLPGSDWPRSSTRARLRIRGGGYGIVLLPERTVFTAENIDNLTSITTDNQPAGASCVPAQTFRKPICSEWNDIEAQQLIDAAKAQGQPAALGLRVYTRA